MNNRRHIITILLSILLPIAALAFDLGTYASSSKLAKGKWVKISVPESGMYQITNSQLSKWGFSDPSKVRVYGYGGKRIPSSLSKENYIDDLPMVQTVQTSSGIAFYGVGTEEWSQTGNAVWVNLPNIYTTVGYYFLSDTGEEARPIEEQGTAGAQGTPATTFVDRLHYELDRVSPGEAGYLLVGESFKSQSTRKVTFDVEHTDSMSFECAIVSNSGVASTVAFTVNGKSVPGNDTDKIPTTSSSTYLHGTFSAAAHSLKIEAGNKIEVSITVNNASAMRDCWLDYLSVNAKRDLALPKTQYLQFWGKTTSYAVDAKGYSGLTVLDVTDPQNITKLRLGEGGKFTTDYSGMRTYVAFAQAATLPTPAFVGNVANQDIHAMPTPDMVIFSLPDYIQQAQRIAALHAAEQFPLTVEVLNVNDVYNEFGSGAADVMALRKCLKMLYDRGEASDSTASLRYALLFGKATYDNRHLTSQFDAGTYSTIPWYIGGERRNQLSDNGAFGTDDFIAMLADNSGTSLGMDELLVGVGRIPVRSVTEAKSTIDKLEQYMLKRKNGTWRNSFIFLADDGNEGVHVEQTETMINKMLATPQQQNFVSKVYVDAYDIIGGSCEGGRQDMYRMLNEGVVWWNFCGHANNHSWTGENMLNYNDINNLYLNKVPVLLAATCDFLRWDSNTISGGEILYHERYGGNIATISATRPVYITDNGLFTAAVGRAINKRDSTGMLPRIGEIYRMAKNGIVNSEGKRISNTNRLRYVLMGDPAMQLAMPHNIVTLDSIGNEPLDDEGQVTIMALQQVELKGSVVSPQGDLLSDFNGVVEVNLYDADRSNMTQGKRDDNVKIIFEQHGDKLFAGSAPVVNGRYTLKVAMPSEVADNFRPATLNMMAYATNGTEAVGVNRGFFVYGLDEQAPADTIPPSIDKMYLNSETFADGDAVNEAPMLIAYISDNTGINLSSAGIGHQMNLMLDGSKSYNDVSQYYTPSTDGTPSGMINYPMSALTNGHHTIRLRIWDVAGNSTSKELTFNVQAGLQPNIFDVYCDQNPAKYETNFYVTHDRPDSELTITVQVYNLLGRPVWESTVKGRSEMSQSTPVNWNLCDKSGRRVPRGIYLYSASISTDGGQTYTTARRKLAIASE